jgi:hypothetical protein
MFSWITIDVIAALVGVICAGIAFFHAKSSSGDVAAVAVGFASGSSAFLLVISAIALYLPGRNIFDSLMSNNKVLLFGAIGYAAFINLRTVPGLLDLLERRKRPPSSGE